MKIKPIGNRILVKELAASDKIGRLWIPEQAKQTPAEMEVVALGTGKLNDVGKKIPFEVKVGDKILTSKYGGSEVRIADETFKLFGADEILAILK